MTDPAAPEPSSPSPADLPGRLARVRPGWLVAAGLSAYLVLSFWILADESPTYDEGAHLIAGYAAWTRGDFRLNPEHPPLAKLVAALPLLAQNLQWPQVDAGWERGDAEEFSYRFLYQSGNDPDRMFFWARTAMLSWGVLLIVSIYAAARSWVGPRGASIALALACLSPAFLAHGHLVATDLPLAVLALLTVMAFRRYLRTPTSLWAAATGAGLGAALLAKYSALLLVPILAWMAGAALVLRRLKPSAGQSSEPAPVPARRWSYALQILLLITVPWLLIWGVYGFRYAAAPDAEFRFADDRVLTKGSAIDRLAGAAGARRLLPEAYLHGLTFVHEHSQKRSAYALGAYSETGWSWYFPFAALVKTPVGTLALCLAGFWVLGRRVLRGDGEPLDLLIPVFVFGAAAVTSRLNIGERHLFPIYPFLMVAAGAVASVRLSATAARGVAALALAAALEGVAACPYPLTHFNVASRLLYERHQMLVDSNLDWGQDLRRLKAFMDRRGIAEIKLAYFGTASPAHLGLRHQALPALNWYTRYESTTKGDLDLRPGEWVAISATAFVGVYARERTAYLDRFAGQTPVAIVGNSILVFQVPAPKEEAAETRQRLTAGACPGRRPATAAGG